MLDFYEREKPEKNLSNKGRTNGGTWISDSNRWRDSELPELDSGFQSPGFRIPQKKKFKEIRFHKEQFPEVQNPDYLPSGEVSISRGGYRGGASGPLIFRGVKFFFETGHPVFLLITGSG